MLTIVMLHYDCIFFILQNQLFLFLQKKKKKKKKKQQQKKTDFAVMFLVIQYNALIFLSALWLFPPPFFF